MNHISFHAINIATKRDIILYKMADDQGIEISLTYNGPDVDDGTMPVGDVVTALQGFSGAYSKIASEHTPQIDHQLRVLGVKTGSFDLRIIAWAILSDPAAMVQIFEKLEKLTHAVQWIFSRIVDVIALKKHAKGRPTTVDVTGDRNTVIVINAEGAKLEVPPEVYDIFASKLLDTDLNRIVNPLRPKRINRLRMKVGDKSTEIPAVEIDSSERDFFIAEPKGATTTQPTEIIGSLVSLNKESNKGTFRLQDGTGVPYRFNGDDAIRFHQEFGRRGQVRARGTATLDDNLRPVEIEINSVERLQGHLFPSGE
jgi:hypothetical protein